MLSLVERVALAVITRAAPPLDREWILGDVVEEFARLCAEQGRRHARAWLLGEAFRACTHVAGATVKTLGQHQREGDGVMQTLLYRCSLRSSASATVAGLYRYGDADARAVDWRERRNLQRRTGRAGRAVAVRGAGSTSSACSKRRRPRPTFPMAPADFRDYRAELQTFDGIAAYMRADLQLGDMQQPEHLRGMQVTAGFFKLLGSQPAIGREFEDGGRD